MAEEQAPETAATETNVETPAASAPRVFTQDEVNRLVGKARKEGVDSERKKQPVATSSTEDDSERVTKAELIELNARLARKDQFRDVADEHDFPKAARKRLAAMFEVDKPTDAAEWARAVKSELGLGATTVNPDPAKPTETPIPDVAAPRAPSTPNNPITTGGIVNLFGMNEATLGQMSPMEMRGHFEKILEQAHSQSGAPTRPTPPRK